MKNNSKDFKKIVKPVLDLLYQYVDDSQAGKGKVLQQKSPEFISGDLELQHWIQEGSINEENIVHLIEKYLSFSNHLHHPKYIGHQVAVPHLIAGMADLVHGVINNPMAIYEMGPAAASMEKVVINWMLDKIGWFKGDNLHESRDTIIQGGGVLTHGGSLANLTAMLAARAHLDQDAWTEGLNEDVLVLVPESSHYSIARAVSIMGMGSRAIIHLPVDKNEVLIPEKCASIIEKCKLENRKIMALTANACATSTGLYDPLDEMAELCLENNLWFHVDAAHGAGALLLPKKKQLMKGIQKANSMIWDGHKMLRTSALSAAVLFRDHQDLDKTFRQKGDYLIFDQEKVGFDFMFNTVECTKNALGPKIFWALAAEGEKGMANYISNCYEHTLSFYHFIQEQIDFECPYEPQSNILCFRYILDDPRIKEPQLAIRQKLIEKGDFYITATTINSIRYLRLTVMNELTQVNHIEELLNQIREIVHELQIDSK